MRLAIVGAGGYMGRELIRIVRQTKNVTLTAALEHKGSQWLGKDAGTLAGIDPLGVPVIDDPSSVSDYIDGILDFTRPEASVVYAKYAARFNIIHVIGTTGFSGEEEKAIATAACSTKIVKSGNMSTGINLLAGFARKAAQLLSDDDFDIEILEMHHRRKVDAPSGTALLLGKHVAKGRKIELEKHSIHARDGITGKRQKGSIGFATLRGGTVTGEHSVIFAGEGERIVFSHSAEDRSIFARGAVRAALWAQNMPNGLYSMLDVLGLSD